MTDISELAARKSKLEQQRAVAQSKADSAQERLDNLIADMESEYGVSTLDELEKLIKRKNAELTETLEKAEVLLSEAEE